MDAVVRDHAVSALVAPPLAYADQKSGWAGLLQKSDAHIQSFYQLDEWRSRSYVTDNAKDLANCARYAYAIARLCVFRNERHGSPVLQGAFRDRAFGWYLPSAKSLTADNGVHIITLDLDAEFIMATYNFAAACLQAAVIEVKRYRNDTATLERVLRLVVCAQHTFSLLSHWVRDLDRVQSGQIIVEGETTPAPAPLNSTSLDILGGLAHALLTTVHITFRGNSEDETYDRTADYYHAHCAYSACYETLPSNITVFRRLRLSVIPGLAERSIAVNRHLSLALTYHSLMYRDLDAAAETNGRSRSAEAVAVLGMRALDACTKSVNKNKALIDLKNGKTDLVADPFVLGRAAVEGVIQTLRAEFELDAIEDRVVSLDEEDAIHRRLVDEPTLSDIPGGPQDWKSAEFETRLIDISLKCAALIVHGSIEDEAPAAATVRNVIAALYHDHDLSRDDKVVTSITSPPTHIAIIARYPDQYRPYGALFVALGRYTILADKLDAIKSKRHATCVNAFECIHNMVATLFFQCEPDRFMMERETIVRLGRHILDKNHDDAIQSLASTQPPMRSLAHLPAPDGEAFGVLMDCLKGLRLMIENA